MERRSFLALFNSAMAVTADSASAAVVWMLAAMACIVMLIVSDGA